MVVEMRPLTPPSTVAPLATSSRAGYAVDIECGGAEPAVYNRSISFFDAFGSAMRALNKSVSWWVHYSENPDMSFPNAASYIYTMDTYR